MTNLIEQVLEESSAGCCVIRMGACQCETHARETARAVAARLRRILQNAQHGNAGPELVALLQELETC